MKEKLKKKCNKCGKILDETCFVKHKQSKNGYSNICKKCKNIYLKKWKQEHSQELSDKRRKRYAETYGQEVKKREAERKAKYPLKVRCQLLRSGMRDRARIKNIEFDADFFTVAYLMKRLEDNNTCECCNKKLNEV